MTLNDLVARSFSLFGLPCVWNGTEYLLFDPANIKMCCFERRENLDDPNLRERLLEMGFVLNPEPVFVPSNRQQITMILTTDCNLACPYCYTVSKVNPTYLDKETALAILNEVIDPTKQLYLQFFGGEPSLNLDCLKAITEYVIGRVEDHFLYITTNGVFEEEEVLEYLIGRRMSFYLSLDGTKPFNDRNRVTCKGKLGTYDRVVETLDRILAAELAVKIRSTVTADNVIDMVPFATEMFQRGVRLIHFCPKVELGLGANNYIEDNDQFQDDFVQGLGLVLDLARRYGAKVITTGSLALGQPMRPYCKILDTNGKILITPEGRRTLCYGTQDEYNPVAEHFLYGRFNVGSGFSYNEEVRTTIAAAFEKTRSQCQECFAQFVCNGGCLAENLSATGHMETIDQAWCQMQRKLWLSTILRIFEHSGR